MERTSFTLPIVDGFTATFWDAAREERFLIRHCATCGRRHFYPRRFCPSCWSEDVSWVEASGTGTLYSWSVVRRNDVRPFDRLVPYIPALVELSEGPRVMTRIVDAAPEELRVDMPVEVCFRAHADVADSPVVMPFFRPSRTDRTTAP